MTEANNRSYVGIDAIVQTCSKVYPDQLNPTQATSVVKYWFDSCLLIKRAMRDPCLFV